MLRIYRGREGMISWALHRLTGLGVLLFLVIHIADIFVVGYGPDEFNSLLYIYNALDFQVVAYEAAKMKPLATITVTENPLGEQLLRSGRHGRGGISQTEGRPTCAADQQCHGQSNDGCASFHGYIFSD